MNPFDIFANPYNSERIRISAPQARRAFKPPHRKRKLRGQAKNRKR